MSTCPAIGELQVGGRPIAAFRCDREEGHASGRFPRVAEPGDLRRPTRILLEPTPHRYVLEWADSDDVMMLPEASLFDPDESFDNVVPIERPEPEPCPLCGRRHFAAPDTAGVCDR